MMHRQLILIDDIPARPAMISLWRNFKHNKRGEI